MHGITRTASAAMLISLGLTLTASAAPPPKPEPPADLNKLVGQPVDRDGEVLSATARNCL